MKFVHKLVAVSVVVLAVVSISERSHAQSWGTESVESLSEQLRQGVRLEDDKWVLKPRFSFGMGYDQNVYLAPDGTEAVSDYFYQIVPGLEFLYGMKQHNYFMLTYDFVDRRYFDETNEDHKNHEFEAAFHYDSGKTVLHVRNKFAYEFGADLEAGERLDRTRNVLGGDLEYRLSEKTSLGALGSIETVDYDNIVYVDHNEYRAGLRIYYEALPKTDFFGDMTYGLVRPGAPRFNRVAMRNVPRSYSDADYQEYSVGTRYRASVKTVVIGRVGYQFREFDDERIENLDTWVMSAEATSRVGERTTLGLDASRRIVPSITESGHNFFNTRLGGHVRRRLFGRNLFGRLAVAFEQSEFYDNKAYEYRTDDYWPLSVGLSWRINQYLALGFDYTHTTNTSTDNTKDVSRDVLLFSARANY